MLKIDKVIAVQNYALSGTSLMHSLLDGHPQIMSTLMLQDYGGYYYLWEEIKNNPTPENAFHIFRNRFYGFFNADYGDPTFKEMGEMQNERLEVSEQEFYRHFQEYFKSHDYISRKQFIVGIFVAYNLCHNRSFSDDAFICFPIHSQPKIYAQYLTEDFKEVFFLHMIREPVQNAGAMTKYIVMMDYKTAIFKGLLDSSASIILSKLATHHTSDIELYQTSPYFADRSDEGSFIQSRYIRLEDLHLQPKETLQKICNWLKIEWNDCLMDSTFMGKKWYNRVGFLRVSGFNKKIIEQKYDQYFNWFDRYRLKLLSKNEQEYFGYHSFSFFDKIIYYSILPILLLLPFKLECKIDRILRRLDILLAISVIDRDFEEWIAKNYHKKDFLEKLSDKISSLYNPKVVKEIVLLVQNNLHSKGFVHQLINLLKKYERRYANLAGTKWILNDVVFSYYLARKEATRSQTLQCFFVYFKLLILRCLKNYYRVRKNMFAIWRNRVFNKSASYVKQI